jgi:hypothetical protein
MAGKGFAPKAKDQRRNRVEPSRGEWVDLLPLEAPVLPEVKDLCPRAQALYDAWRADPVTGTFGPSEVAATVELARLQDEFESGGDPDLKFQRVTPSELRLRMDGLGLTLKGKRDLRVRLVSASSEPEAARVGAEVRRLRAVDPVA